MTTTLVRIPVGGTFYLETVDPTIRKCIDITYSDEEDPIEEIKDCTAKEVVDAVKKTTDFCRTLTHEQAADLQTTLNGWNVDRNVRVCILTAVDESGFSWHVYGPTVELDETDMYELCAIFRHYMTPPQRRVFDNAMTYVYPWYFQSSSL